MAAMQERSPFERVREVGIIALFAIAVIVAGLSVYRSHVRGKGERPTRGVAAIERGAAGERRSNSASARPDGARPARGRLERDALEASAGDRTGSAAGREETTASEVAPAERKLENETRAEGTLVPDQAIALEVKDFMAQGTKPTIRFTRTAGAIEAEVALVSPIMTGQQFVARLALLDGSGRVLEEADALFASAPSAGTTATVAGYRIEEDESLATFRAEPKTLRFTFENEEALAHASRFRLRVGVLWQPRVDDAYTYDPTNGTVSPEWRVKQ
jgi:hypothetical protein